MGEHMKLPMFVALVPAGDEAAASAIVKAAQRAGIAFKKQLSDGRILIVSEKKIWGTIHGDIGIMYGEIQWKN